MLSYIFKPLVEKLDDNYWDKCEPEVKKDFITLNNDFI